MAAVLVRAFDLPAASEDPFVDTQESVFVDDIARLAAAGVTRGCNPPANDRFCPDDPVTRGQMAAFLKRALSGETEPPPTTPPTTPPTPPPTTPPTTPAPTLTVAPEELASLPLLGIEYRASLEALHGEPPYTWSVAEGPDWLHVDPGTGEVSLNLEALPIRDTTSQTLTVTVTDSDGA